MSYRKLFQCALLTLIHRDCFKLTNAVKAVRQLMGQDDSNCTEVHDSACEYMQEMLHYNPILI